MPFEYYNKIVVTKAELVPNWYNGNTLQSIIERYKDKPFGIKRVQIGGNGRPMLIDFDSLPQDVQKGIGDPRKVGHILERFYKQDAEAVRFFATYRFDDGSYLDQVYQDKYVINANMLNALLSLRYARETERRTKGGTLVGITATLLSDAVSFQKVLATDKYKVQHTLPESEKRFKQALKDFEKDGLERNYVSLISAKHKNSNSRKVFDHTIEFLNNLFADATRKPTPTEVSRRYDSFKSGYLEVMNNNTGEIYNPEDFKNLGTATVTNYLVQWQNKIATYAKRSGDRQKLMQQFKPHHSLDKPKYAGSIISIDDRQPPFEYEPQKRLWFYNGIDLGSEAFTVWVHGRDKAGIIIDFYRQMIRNYHEWGFNLPLELEAEMSLNSSFTGTFLKEGVMFDNVRIEANNARGKRIEAYFKQLRYAVEKDRIGWLARPFAMSEANQKGPAEKIQVPYNQIVTECLHDIVKWNNMAHSVHTDKSRWEVFCQMQNPNTKPTNYQSILPHLGYHERSSCNVGIVRFRYKEFLLGQNNEVTTGNDLITLMRELEGSEIDIYWLDDNQGGVLKALIFKGTRYVCEAIAKPTYNRAKSEWTDKDLKNREVMSKYVMTIEAYANRQRKALDTVTIINNEPERPQTFTIPGLKSDKVTHSNKPADTMPDTEEEDYDNLPAQSFVKTLKDRY
jgi:hypothetical protein